jgi:hypothetical protein
VLRNHLDIFSSFVEHKVPLDEAEEVSHAVRPCRHWPVANVRQYYKLFEKNLISKTVFVMGP